MKNQSTWHLKNNCFFDHILESEIIYPMYQPHHFEVQLSTIAWSQSTLI